MPIKSRTGDGYDERRGKVPCEASIGCKKGHWKEKPDLSDSQRSVIDLYHASVATGGACLNASERGDWWLSVVFGRLREMEQMRSRSMQEALVANLSMVQASGVMHE